MVYILLFYDFNVLLLAKRMGKMVFHFATFNLSSAYSNFVDTKLQLHVLIFQVELRYLINIQTRIFGSCA